ncbi:MAG: folate-binding protein [Lysobacteraceae bacterium]
MPGWQLAEVSGSDAGAFLQAQLMNDVRALAPLHWQWNGWLNPKGRVIALFALIALDADRYWLLVPDMPAVELIARLQRFVFRSKVKLTARADCMAFGTFAQPHHANGSNMHREASGNKEIVELDFSARGGPRALRIETDIDAPTASVAPEADVQRWATFDLAHGLPHLGADQIESWTPQMLSLERLHAFSLKKGCYPGQEIVARTHYLGQAKRGLVRIAGSALAVGNEVSADGRVLGSIVSSIGDEALAVLAVDRPTTGLECAGTPCSEMSLLDGLAR